MFGVPKEPLGPGAVLRPCRNWTSRGPMGSCAHGVAVFTLNWFIPEGVLVEFIITLYINV